jgi:hypothetical protein
VLQPVSPKTLERLGEEREGAEEDAMCFKVKFNSRERTGCCLLVVIIIVLVIGVLFGMGVFRHGYDKFRDLGRNHTCYDCDTH